MPSGKILSLLAKEWRKESTYLHPRKVYPPPEAVPDRYPRPEENTSPRAFASFICHRSGSAVKEYACPMANFLHFKRTSTYQTRFSLYPFHPSRSRLRYWIASARCSTRISSESARSAIVRDTLRMRSYAREERPSRSIAVLRRFLPV